MLAWTMLGFLGRTACAVAAGPSAGLDVVVVNPPSAPVPVALQGTSSISGTVLVGNPLSLNPATPNPVTIVSAPNAPSIVNVGNAVALSERPFQMPFTCATPDYATNFYCDAPLVNRSAMVAKIEFVSAQCYFDRQNAPIVRDPDAIQQLKIDTVFGGAAASHYLVRPVDYGESLNIAGTSQFQISQPVLAFADPASTILFRAVANPTNIALPSGPMSCAGTLTGHYVPG